MRRAWILGVAVGALSFAVIEAQAAVSGTIVKQGDVVGGLIEGMGGDMPEGVFNFQYEEDLDANVITGLRGALAPVTTKIVPPAPPVDTNVPVQPNVPVDATATTPAVGRTPGLR